MSEGAKSSSSSAVRQVSAAGAEGGDAAVAARGSAGTSGGGEGGLEDVFAETSRCGEGDVRPAGGGGGGPPMADAGRDGGRLVEDREPHPGGRCGSGGGCAPTGRGSTPTWDRWVTPGVGGGAAYSSYATPGVGYAAAGYPGKGW